MDNLLSGTSHQDRVVMDLLRCVAAVFSHGDFPDAMPFQNRILGTLVQYVTERRWTRSAHRCLKSIAACGAEFARVILESKVIESVLAYIDGPEDFGVAEEALGLIRACIRFNQFPSDLVDTLLGHLTRLVTLDGVATRDLPEKALQFLVDCPSLFAAEASVQLADPLAEIVIDSLWILSKVHLHVSVLAMIAAKQNYAQLKKHVMSR